MNTAFVFAFVLHAGVLASATAPSRLQQLHTDVARLYDAPRSLITYYLSMSDPYITPAAEQSARSERTAITVKLHEPSVSRFMPVVTPSPAGMTHEVASTWSALKNLALMFERAKSVPQAAPGSNRRFVMGGYALAAASDTSPDPLDVGQLIDTAEALGQRGMWTDTKPGSALLLPYGQSTGAVADVMDVTYDESSSVITLNLDVVHRPHTITEFEPHAEQALDVSKAHYHFYTTPGVNVDASGWLNTLQASKYKLEGLHMFVKWTSVTCYSVTMTLTPSTPVAVGSTVRVTVTAVQASCGTTTATGGRTVVAPVCSSCAVALSLTGPGVFVAASSGTVNRGAPAGDSRQGTTITATTDTTGVAWADVRVTGSGPIAVRASTVAGGAVVGAGGTVTVNAATPGPVAKLMLLPARAYRRLNDPLTLTVVALDAANLLVPNVVVTLAIQGDTQLVAVDSITKVTDASGSATFLIASNTPSAVAVVAGAVTPGGVAITSAASHIIFFGSHDFWERREKEYYGGHHDGHGRDDEYYGRDADSYARAATTLAIQQANKLATTTAN